ncbi:nicotinate-nucleotide adenylyltransferase [candidate division KSB1 bacterium]|nr:nicotinate-nucleotide adenylyltransferase [candidate division KSB1 bacterium]
MKLGLYGGTFDPIHIAHLIIAEIACETFHLNELIFMPCAVPPHKNHLNMSDAHHRLKMIRLAIAGNPKFRYSDMEIKRGGTSYTVQTLEMLIQRNKIDPSDLYLIIGADNFQDFHKWKEPEHIMELCQLIVVGRPSFDLDNFNSGYRNKSYEMPIPLMEISSSDIRDRVKNNKSIRYMVTDNVIDYIKKNNLYSL